MKRTRPRRAMTYRAILLLVASFVLILDVILAVLLYQRYISPTYTRNLYTRMQSAYETVRQDPTGTFYELERENVYVLVAAEDGDCVYASLAEQRGWATELVTQVDSAAVLPVIQTSESGDKGQLAVLGRSGDYYICVSTQLDPIYAVAYTFLRYSILIGLILWAVTAVVIIHIERKIFAPITEAVQVAKSIARQDFTQRCGSGGIARQSQALAQSLNEMSDQLQAAMTQLHQANDQLRQDIETIERKERAMKNLVSNLSHDLKTPLALISGYAEGLAAGTARTEQQRQEYCAIITDETERMRQIIARMSALSQLEGGQVQLESEDFDLSELLDHTLNQFRLELEREGVAVTRDYAPDQYVSADYIACDQILTNLIQNAIYHSTAPKQITVRTRPAESPAGKGPAPAASGDPKPVGSRRRRNPVRLAHRAWTRLRRKPAPAAGTPVPSQSPSPPARIRVEIFNTCDPIEPQTLVHLFDRFYRSESSRRRPHGEMGLGLAIVRGNMELMGLPYGVENVPGGVLFWIELPALK